MKRDKQIGVIARRHAKAMAANYAVYHDSDMGQKITRWRRLGQNSGASTACRRMARNFMSSSGHRSNILGQWRFIGIGTDWRNHRLFVQQVFEWRRDPGNIYHYP